MKMLFRRITRLSIGFFMVMASLAITPSTISALEDNGNPIPSDGVVSIDKTRGEGDEGLYEITLKVSGNPEMMPSDVVLVMDTSNSMEGRMADAKLAATDFVTHLLGLGQGHRIAVVSFGDNPANVHALSSDATSLNGAINGLGLNGGTHMEGGIKLARDILGAPNADKNQAIIVISDGSPTYGYDFDMEYTGEVEVGLTSAWVTPANQLIEANFTGSRYDFDYTNRIGSGSSINASKTFNVSGLYEGIIFDWTVTGSFTKDFSLKDSVVWQANQAIASGFKMYTIGLSVNAEGADVLQAAQDSGYFTGGVSDLPAIYTSLLTQFSFAAHNGVVTDIIGDNFDYVGISPGYEAQNTSYDEPSKTLTWNVGTIGSLERLLKYQVRIHEGLPEGTYPTNEEATIDYTNLAGQAERLFFPVPQVELENQAPIADDLAFTVAEGGTHLGNVIATDPESDPLTFMLETGPSHGSLTFNADGSFTYVHDGTNTVSDSFTFIANDGFLDSNIATVTINIDVVYELNYYINRDLGFEESSLLTTVTFGVEEELMPLEPTCRVGSEFFGWFTDETYATEFTGFDAMPDMDVDVYGYCLAEMFTFTFDPNHTGDLPVETEFKAGTDVEEEYFNRMGYTFIEWTEDEEGTIPYVGGFTNLPAEDISIYAQWEMTEFILNYVTNMPGLSYPDETFNMGGTIIPPEPSVPGYNFLGWYWEPEMQLMDTEVMNGENGIEFLVPFEHFDDMPPFNVEVIALWEVIDYTFTFDPNFGTEANVEQIFQVGGDVAGTTFTQEGFIFDGWTTDEAGLVPYTAGLTNLAAADVYVYAQWAEVLGDEDGYEITFVTNQPTVTIANIFYVEGEAIAKPEPTVEGYTFLGWYIDPAFTEEFDRFDLMPGENVIVYADWGEVLGDEDEIPDTSDNSQSTGLGILFTLLGALALIITKKDKKHTA